MTDATDYYPICPGQIHRYRLRDLEGDRQMAIEVLTISRKGAVTIGKCKQSTLCDDGEIVSYFMVNIKSSGVFKGKRKLFPLPINIGEKWRIGQDSYGITSLNETKEGPAGTFRDCLEITHLVAGGDAGSGLSLYAPGIGLIYAYDKPEDGSDNYEIELVSYKIQKGNLKGRP